MKEKTNAVWRVLVGQPLPIEVVKSINDLAEIRNAFVHYKWPDVVFDNPNPAAVRQEGASLGAEALIASLMEIEDQTIFGGRREFLRTVIDSVIDGVGGN